MFSFDFLVIGSGIGGLGFALKVADKATVAILCKAEAAATNTNLAQGGISAVTAFPDSVEQHIQDTLTAGAGLCDPETVRILAEKAPDCIKELQEADVNFTRNSEGALDLGREGGHHQNRIVHTHDHTGFSIQQALLQKVKNHPNITLLEHHFAIDLLLANGPNGKKKCLGVQTFSTQNHSIFPVYAGAVMLAAGGAGQVFKHTTNAGIATGDGIAMASRAGAAIKDLEFVQFHPTALYDPAKPTFLISEAVRGFGGELVTAAGLPFMQNYHAMGSLAPRDVVSRAILQEMQKAGASCVYLDLRQLPAPEIKARFPKIYARCRESQLNLATDLIPVVPAAHYICGGIVTDPFGRTTIDGLYACGENACTGVHGANRLASNSLPEAWIFAGRAASHALIAFPGKARPAGQNPEQHLSQPPSENRLVPETIISRKKEYGQRLMWRQAGIVRTTTGMLFAKEQLSQLQTEVENLLRTSETSVSLLELRNLVQVALAILTAAINRKESVGCHFVNSANHPSAITEAFAKAGESFA